MMTNPLQPDPDAPDANAGEQLEGSGFEDQEPEIVFSDNKPEQEE